MPQGGWGGRKKEHGRGWSWDQWQNNSNTNGITRQTDTPEVQIKVETRCLEIIIPTKQGFGTGVAGDSTLNDWPWDLQNTVTTSVGLTRGKKTKRDGDRRREAGTGWPGGKEACRSNAHYWGKQTYKDENDRSFIVHMVHNHCNTRIELSWSLEWLL